LLTPTSHQNFWNSSSPDLCHQVMKKSNWTWEASTWILEMYNFFFPCCRTVWRLYSFTSTPTVFKEDLG
jgi:hypothetical protein